MPPKQTRPSPLSRFHLSTDHLYPIIVLAGFAFFIALVPLEPNDFWWHLKIGQWIFEHGSIPQSNLFAWSLPADAPFVYAAWLGEWLLYQMYRIGGVDFLTLLRSLLIITTFALVAVAAQRSSGSWKLSALAVGLLSLMSLNNLTVRPQIWAWLPFVIFAGLLERFASGSLRPRTLLIALPLILIFWTNVHGSFILGGALVGIYFAGEIIAQALRPQAQRQWQTALSLLAVGILCGAAMLANPRGIGIAAYVGDLLTDQPSQSLIMEWQTPSTQGLANAAFYASILLFLLALAFSKTRLSPTELLLYLSFLWLAWSGVRYIIWYGIVSLPIFARLVSGLPVRIHPVQASRNLLNNLIAIIVCLPLFLVLPWNVENLPISEEYWKSVLHNSPAGHQLSTATPVQAAEYLKAHPGGKLFNEMGYGSYLIWSIPEQRVFIDPRVELYPYEQWQDYVRITRATNYNALLEKYGADRILLDIELTPELASALTQDAAWELEYSDARAQIWQRK